MAAIPVNARDDLAALPSPAEGPVMSAVQLSRLDPARNMARFYSLAVQQDLFGSSAVYERGRIGAAGTVKLDLSSTPGRGAERRGTEAP